MSLADAHVAIAKESSWGTAASLTQGLLCDPKEWDIRDEWANIESSVRLPGQDTLTTTFARVLMGITGQGAGDLLDKGMGILLEAMFGSLSSATHPTEGGLNRFTLTPSVSGKKGKGLTLQLYKAYMDSLGRAFTGIGAKVLGFKLMCDKGGNVRYAVTLDGRDIANSGHVITCGTTNASPNITMAAGPGTAGIAVGMVVTGTGIPASSTVRSITDATTFVLGNAAGDASVDATATAASVALTFSRGAAIAKISPSYATNTQPFGWNGTSVLTLDGQAACCSGWEISYDFKLATDRRFLCSGGLKDEQVATGELSSATLTLKGLEWLDAGRQYERYSSMTSAGSLAAFALTCSTASPTVNSTKAALSLAIPTARAKSGPPDMRGGQPAEFDILGSFTALYDTPDSAP